MQSKAIPPETPPTTKMKTSAIENSLAEQYLAETFGPDLGAGTEAIAAFAAAFTVRAVNQLRYDLTTNVSRGITTRNEAKTAAHAIEHGVASAFNAIHHWDCDAAVKLAYAILEDANCHSEAAAMLVAAKKNGITL